MKLSKQYDPKLYEADIYALWEKNEAFKPVHRGSDKSFAMVFPLPNANGDLHLGHGLTNAIYDIVTRYHRMKGEAALYLPGADHAGFETQVVYEKQLAKEGKSRFDFTRDELYAQVWDFVEQNKHNFESQFRRLGASCDWDHYTYTLDEKIVAQAFETFKQLWDDGLIYRGERLVNFCTFHGTGFADIEVEHKEQKGHIWSIRYPRTDGSGEVVIATTRPETMLGDVAVAVHPEDDRYKYLIGKTVKLPLTNREIPVIADEFVDRDFGTGAVKITPAHDHNDYDAGKRHDLPMISVIGTDGAITQHAPEAYHGLSVKEAREQVVLDLKSGGFLVEVNDHVNNVGHCYKCGTVIEPLLREQWFVSMKPLAARAIEALKANKIEFHPLSKKDQLIEYLEGLRDWNISRQIAWGIPIPAFQNVNEPNDWIFDTNVDQEIIKIGEKTYRRDPDVFDTWFSSSSWPYATLDYPDGKDFKEFYPTGLLDTGSDILYPWVSRMIMLGLYTTGEVPFKGVYLHGLILDPKGAKMSKSKGNVVNPIEKIDTYGSDAFRMGIVADESPAAPRPYDESKLVGARNFCNKLWNIARYIEGVLDTKLEPGVTPKPVTEADHWIVNRLNQGGEEIGEFVASYRFSEAYNTLYHLIWDDVADWYIEASKTAQNVSVLNYTLETILKLAHPFAPFVSETIWQTLHPSTDSLLITSAWPKTHKIDAKNAGDFEQIKAIVSEIRQLKTLLKIPKGSLHYADAPLVSKKIDLISSLAKLDETVTVVSSKGIVLTKTTEPVWLDVDASETKKLLQTLQDKSQSHQAQIDNLGKRLSNPNYTDKAPSKLVEETRSQLASLEQELQTISEQIERLTGLT